MVQELAGEHGGADFAWATSPRSAPKLWQARHDAYLRRASACSPAARGLGDRCLRADLAARRMHRRDREGPRGERRSSRRSSAMSATAISISRS